MKIVKYFCILFVVAMCSAMAFGEDVTRTMNKWSSRPYIVHLPPNAGTRTLPVVLALHGGGGNAAIFSQVTCKDGDKTSPSCLNNVADKEGFVVVYPNGSYNPQGCAKNPKACNMRTFNAGGGTNGYNCTSAYACESNIDDIAFFNDLLDDLPNVTPIDPTRIYATGISNGGAMSHRLACQLSNRIAAIAPVASGNQFSTALPCRPKRSVPILEIHGLSDPVWPYLGGPSNLPSVKGNMVSESITLKGWLNRNQCDESAGTTRWLPTEDPVNHTRVGVAENVKCANNSVVIHYFIEGGGHTWPGGWQYSLPTSVGRVSYAISGSQVIWDFFKNQRLR